MREPRLGDDIDDYCVRCKRVMNHSIVSVLNGEAAKVRCRTCHSDHDYRHEQAPPPKVDPRKAALFNEVLKKVDPEAEALPADPLPEADAELETEVDGIPAEAEISEAAAEPAGKRAAAAKPKAAKGRAPKS